MTDAISLGVDVGSTSVKVVALDQSNARVEHVRSAELRSFVQSLPGHYEEDPHLIRDLVFDLIRSVARQYGDRIRAIGFTGQMHTGLLIDSTLRPLSNAVTWQDKRGDESSTSGATFVGVLRRVAGEDVTGVGIHTGFLSVTTLWWKERNLLPSNAIPIGIYDWIASTLAGKAVTDITSAAAWGMYDIVRKQWKMEIVEAIGLSHQALPEVAEPGDTIGVLNRELAAALGLSTDVRIHASIGDTQASYLGSGVRNDEILLNVGTGSQSMWEVTVPEASHGTDIRYLLRDRYIATAPTLAGGKAYQMLADFYASVLREIGGVTVHRSAIYEAMNTVAMRSLEESAGPNDVVVDPIFAGSRRKPSGERASIKGLTAGNFEVGGVTRALLEGMIEEIACPYFAREGELHHKGLVGAGNGMRRNAALRTVAERRFELPIRLAESNEEAARGAALLTLL